MSLTRKRAAVTHVQEACEASERQACRTQRQPRSTQRYEARRAGDEAALVTAMRQSVRKHRNHVWTWDVVQDRTTTGGTLRVLTLIDEYARECLAIEMRRNLQAEAALAVLHEVMAARGSPKFVQSDNGSEFVAKAVRGWLEKVNVGTLY